MDYFSNKDIEEAKRRVREMNSRASAFVSGEEKSEEKNEHQADNDKKSAPEINEGAFQNEEKGGREDSAFIILMMLLLLSHEGADNKLLLALLYLLF